MLAFEHDQVLVTLWGGVGVCFFLQIFKVGQQRCIRRLGCCIRGSVAASEVPPPPPNAVCILLLFLSYFNQVLSANPSQAPFSLYSRFFSFRSNVASFDLPPPPLSPSLRINKLDFVRFKFEFWFAQIKLNVLQPVKWINIRF